MYLDMFNLKNLFFLIIISNMLLLFCLTQVIHVHVLHLVKNPVCSQGQLELLYLLQFLKHLLMIILLPVQLIMRCHPLLVNQMLYKIQLVFKVLQLQLQVLKGLLKINKCHLQLESQIKKILLIQMTDGHLFLILQMDFILIF